MAQLLDTIYKRPLRVTFAVVDDASALEAVKRLVTGHETKLALVPSDSPHRCVGWDHGGPVLVRVYKRAVRADAKLEADVAAALGPRILGTFVNGHIEEYLMYHTSSKVHAPPDAVDGLARALAGVHAHAPPLEVLDVTNASPRSWVALRRAREVAQSLSFDTRGSLVKARYAAVAPLVSSRRLDRNLDQLEARVPPGGRVALCHGAAASHCVLRSDDGDARLVDWGAVGVDYAAWDMARALHDDAEALPELADRRAFVSEYLSARDDAPPARAAVNALVNDIQYFTICDNYLRGFGLVAWAHAAATDGAAADLLSKAAARLHAARAQQYVVVW